MQHAMSLEHQPAPRSSQRSWRRAARRRRAGIAAVALALLAGASRLAAQSAGDLDPTFGTGGKATIDFNQSTDIAFAVALQPDGKLVVVGTAYTDNDYSKEDFAVSRFNADGTLDASFGTGGRVKTDFPGLAAVASSVVVQPEIGRASCRERVFVGV